MKEIKLKIVFFLILVFSLSIFYRLYHFQIEKGEYHKALALGQQVSFKQTAGQRGEIFFNNEKTLLAQTRKKNLLYIFPDKVSNKEKLKEFLNKDFSEEIEENKVIRKEITRELFEKIVKENFKGVHLDKIWGRSYPQKELASHVAGFLNREGKGQYGIEGSFDEILKGKEETKKEGKSPFGYLAFWSDVDTIKTDSLKGDDLVLTLDYNIQYSAEKALIEAKENWDIDSGQIIISKPKTGEIAALAVYPGFDPNHYEKEKSLKSFINPVYQELFEPGSIFKPITMASTLEEKLITPTTTYEDKGSVEAGGPPIYNFQERVWGEQSMTDVLEESINTGAVFVQQKLGKELFLKYLERFSFFEKTEIGLQGETFSLNNTLRKGYARDIATASFGQGIEITPLQLIKAFGSIANQGTLMKPLIVKKIIGANEEIKEISPQAEKTIISPRTVREITSMMISVVENGAGRRAKIEGYNIAGKTGTAQIPLKGGGYDEDKTIQSFIGFFPAYDPQFLILIKLDGANSLMAGHSAAPLFKELAHYIINYKEIPPCY